jgi:hypothetical protein
VHWSRSWRCILRSDDGQHPERNQCVGSPLPPLPCPLAASQGPPAGHDRFSQKSPTVTLLLADDAVDYCFGILFLQGIVELMQAAERRLTSKEDNDPSTPAQHVIMEARDKKAEGREDNLQGNVLAAPVAASLEETRPSIALFTHAIPAQSL